MQNFVDDVYAENTMTAKVDSSLNEVSVGCFGRAALLAQPGRHYLYLGVNAAVMLAEKN